MPEEHNLRHVPIEHRCSELGEIYVKYKGVKELLDLVRSFSVLVIFV